MQQHYVTFYSPGTLFSEDSMKEIDSWDVQEAIEMSYDIQERHGSTPYCFRFSTRARGPDDLDAKEIAKSPYYFLGGKIETAEEVLARNDPSERILCLNIQGNGIKRIITNTNSWMFTGVLADDDVVLDYTPRTKQSI